MWFIIHEGRLRLWSSHLWNCLTDHQWSKKALCKHKAWPSSLWSGRADIKLFQCNHKNFKKICTLISLSAVSRLDEGDLQPSAAEVKGQGRIHTRRRRSRSNINPCHLLREFPISLSAAAPAASFQLIDTQAEDSPPWAAGWGVPPGLELCWWSLTWSRNPSLLLPGGEGLLADTINFSSAAPAFKSNLLCRQSSNVIYRQVFTCRWSWLVKRPIDSLHCAVPGGGIT